MRAGPVVSGAISAAMLAMGISAAAPVTEAPTDLQAILDAAEPGATIHLDGTYRGGAIVTKPVTLDGGGTAVIDAEGAGHGIEVTAPDVTLRGLVIRNTGISLDRENAAVSANEAPRLIVEDCRFEDVLFGVFARLSPDSIVRRTTIGAKDLDPGRRGDALRIWESPRTLIANNVVDGGRDSVIWFSDEVIVTGNRFTRGRYGLHFMYNSGALVTGNVLEGNSVGAFMMYSDGVEFRDNFVADNFGPSGYGLGLKEVDGMSASGNHFVGNRIGIYLDNSPLTIGIVQRFENNLIAFNETGVLFTASVERNHFSRNAFIDNGEQVGIAGSGVLSGNEWTIDGVGNHWDDFGGYDADGDGIGDIAYRLDDLYSAMTDRHPEIQFFNETPAARAVDVTARIFPSFRPEAKVIDDAPLVAIPAFPEVMSGTPPAGPGALLAVSLTMIALAATLIGWSRSPGGNR